MVIVNDNDMEIILKGCKDEVIRKMLDNRLFCLIKLPAVKPREFITEFTSSIFVSKMNSSVYRSFAIRNTGSKTIYCDCEYYLKIYYQRGTDEERKAYFEDDVERMIYPQRKIYSEDDLERMNRRLKRCNQPCGVVTYPTLDELLSFLAEKELVLISNWMNYGNMEDCKVKDFLENLLFIWEEAGSQYIRRDEFCDIRIFLSHIDDEDSYPEYGLYCDDIRNFDIRNRIVDQFFKWSKEFYGDENYYSAEYETQTEDVKAAYFLTRFHSNTSWDADPVNIVNVRLSIFILPGTASPREAKKLPIGKKTKNEISGVEYKIESIHCNSDIFSDFDEFKKYIEYYLECFAFD